MDFSVSVRNRHPGSQYFIVSTDQTLHDHYVQAEIEGNRFVGRITLGEDAIFDGVPEPVAVLEATGDAADRLVAAEHVPSGRLPVTDFEELTPPPRNIGQITVLRKPGEC